ncbi:unnamed protein product [Candidula unifasciata]|uniref:Uncharacterized protein n=1 Tax=Candidula unifasciata TaxID=100452 RepID=A0A8S3ZCS8_9EUPU|nr:unnamed protein product [Candidula unifasciata]
MQSPHSKMTLKEKLDFIDEEIRKLHLCCSLAGYTESEIESFAQPFFKKDVNHLGSAGWTSWKAWKKTAAALVVVMLVLPFVYYPAFRVLCGLTRLGGKQILPLLDWTAIWNEGCLVRNPLYEPMNVTMADCEVCENTEQLARLHNLDSFLLMRLREQHVPFIAEDASVNWKNNSNITLAQLAGMYNRHPLLIDKESCKMQSNVRGVFFDHKILLNKVVTGKIDQFYAHWQNCDMSAAKALRQIYKLPYFLPSAYTPPKEDWVLISSNYSSKILKPLSFTQDIIFLIQLKGENHVYISAIDLCKTVCPVLQATLQQGEVLAVPNGIWNIEYLPSNSSENIAIAVEVSF